MTQGDSILKKGFKPPVLRSRILEDFMGKLTNHGHLSSWKDRDICDVICIVFKSAHFGDEISYARKSTGIWHHTAQMFLKSEVTYIYVYIMEEKSLGQVLLG